VLAPASTQALAVLGGVSLVIGLLCGLAGAFGKSASDGVGALALLVVGGLIVYWSKIDAYLVRRELYRAESALAEARYDDEKTEYDRWTKVLGDRPTDAEMARWLDYDKVYIKNRVMKEHSLTNRDIEEYAVVTEPRYPCRKARVVFGPPRYSHYWVTVILLNEAGVRKISMDLDFLDGEVSTTEDRKGFPYNAITMSSLLKVQVRYDGGHRDVTPVSSGEARMPQPGVAGSAPAHNFGPGAAGSNIGPDGAGMPLRRSPGAQQDNTLTLSQSLRISLNNSQYVDFIVENVDEDFLDRLRENVEALFELALDSSGLKAAQQLMEAVASQGQAWLAQRRKLRERRMLDFGTRGDGQTAPEGIQAPPPQTVLAGLPPVLPSDSSPVPAAARPRASQTITASVPVTGGTLKVELASGATTPVLAIHGLARQRRQWDWLRALRPDLSLILPDLRGRGESSDVPGPSSIAQHAADMVAVLDHLRLDAVHVCGVSMGAVVAVEMAARYPDRVQGLVLVDGGFPTPSSVTTPEATPAFVRDLMVNQDVRWFSVDDYAYSFTDQIAPMLSPGDPLLLACLTSDLDETGARRLRGQMLYEELAGVPRGWSAWRHIRTQAWLLTAEWSSGEGSRPTYPPEVLEHIQREIGHLLTVSALPGADHAVSVMSMTGAKATADMIDKALAHSQ
jgi:pimeloyl-ACP methyl ester carboxylesterase